MTSSGPAPITPTARPTHHLLALALLLLAPAGCGGDPSNEVDPGPDASVASSDAPEETCPTGYTGAGCAECAAEYQDVDGDGACQPSCEATGELAFSCAAGTCEVDTQTGDRWCAPSTDSMVLWLDATQGVIVRDGTDDVSAWRDRRGGTSAPSVSTSTATLRPRREPGGLNQRTIVTFDGTDALALSAFPGFKGADYTIVVVLRPGVSTGHGILRTRQAEFGTTVSLARSASTGYTLTHNVPLVGGNGDVVTATLPSASGTKLLVARRWTSGLLDHTRITGNTTDNLAGVVQTNPNLTEGNLGATLHTLEIGADGLFGSLAEVLIYDRAVEDAELAEIRTYLATKWGI